MTSPIDGRFADLDESLFMPRELSWLSFNQRVLQRRVMSRCLSFSACAISVFSRVISMSFSCPGS